MGPREILIILVIVLLLFGAPKLPQLARSLGQSLRILKDETSSLTSDSKDGASTSGAAPAMPPAPGTAATPVAPSAPDTTATSSSDEPRDGEK